MIIKLKSGPTAADAKEAHNGSGRGILTEQPILSRLDYPQRVALIHTSERNARMFAGSPEVQCAMRRRCTPGAKAYDGRVTGQSLAQSLSANASIARARERARAHVSERAS